MTDKEHKPKEEEAEIVAPFTAAQIARIREIVDEQIAKYEMRKVQEARFGVPYLPKEHK